VRSLLPLSSASPKLACSEPLIAGRIAMLTIELSMTVTKNAREDDGEARPGGGAPMPRRSRSLRSVRGSLKA